MNANTRVFLRELDYQGGQDESGVVAGGLNAQRAEGPGLHISPFSDVIVHVCEQFKAALKQPLPCIC